MKQLLFLFTLLTLISCGSDSSEESIIQTPKKQYVNRIISNNTELKFTYNNDDNLIKNETDLYYRDFVYVNNSITQIKSITKPNTPYYTIDFIYDATGKVIEVKRNNHHNNTIYYVTYTYSNNRITKVCTYNSVAEYDEGLCARSYTIEYTDNTKNYTAKILTLENNSEVTVLEPAGFTYDTKNRPYFGVAINKIRLPYATDGTGMDWEIIYPTNNPISKVVVTNLDTGEFAIKKKYDYLYNSDDLPNKMTVKTFDINSGNQISTFEQEYFYELR